MAVLSKNAVIIQLDVTTSKPKNVCIDGSAILTLDASNGPIKDVIQAIANVTFCLLFQAIKYFSPKIRYY